MDNLLFNSYERKFTATYEKGDNEAIRSWEKRKKNEQNFFSPSNLYFFFPEKRILHIPFFFFVKKSKFTGK